MHWAASISLLVAVAVPLPHRLIDGSTTPRVPAVLAAQGGRFVMTKVRVVRAGSIRSRLRTCHQDLVPAREPVVERTGVNGSDLTYLGLYGTVLGCDHNPRAEAGWCGHPSFTFHHGRVGDARLDYCTVPGSGGRVVAGFGWVDPVRYARWIVVDQPGFREVYPVAARLPVRVTTVIGVKNFGQAVFPYAQYDANGVLLVRKTLKPSIAS